MTLNEVKKRIDTIEEYIENSDWEAAHYHFDGLMLTYIRGIRRGRQTHVIQIADLILKTYSKLGNIYFG